MSLISVQNLSFAYGNDFIFQNASFRIDTNWKIGFVGRNGRGKTTFLRLLMGEMAYGGTIETSESFDYFPFSMPDGIAMEVIKNRVAPFSQWESDMEHALSIGDLEQFGEIQELYQANDGYCIEELIIKEANKLGLPESILKREFDTLSYGEQTKLMLAALFLRKNRFLLIDEPTNHLDMEGRRIVAKYLSGKQGFILVSHDRKFLDNCVDHILSINKNTIEVIAGNYSLWQGNKDRQDRYELEQEGQLKKEIRRLEKTKREKAAWSDAAERRKIGFDSVKTEKSLTRRPNEGAKAKKLMKRAKAVQARQDAAIEEKTKLLHNIESAEDLKIHVLPAKQSKLLQLKEVCINYGARPLFLPLDLTVLEGDRIALSGPNGCGKSSLLRLILGHTIPHTGQVQITNGTIVSYVPQSTSHLAGTLKEYASQMGIDETLFKTILRKLDFSRELFDKKIELFSAGQKKKVLLAGSLAQPAHLFIWDEPLNYIDVLSRIQIENLLREFQPTMIFVEHDEVFCQNTANRMILLSNKKDA